MKLGGKTEICVMVGVLLSAGSDVFAASRIADTPYNAIIERNVFNLHPPVNPADLAKAQPVTPPPKITLTGITTILGKKVAFLTAPGPKPGAPAENAMLAEGQAMNEIEVVSIDERAGVVRVKNHGEEETLDFEHNGAKPSGPLPPANNPPPNAFPPPGPAPQGVVPIPQPGNVVRPLRTLNRGTPPVSDNNGGGAPSFGGGVNGSNGDYQQNNASPMSREEQVALIEMQRVKYMQEGNPMSKILPHTEMTSEVTGEPSALDPAAQ